MASKKSPADPADEDSAGSDASAGPNDPLHAFGNYLRNQRKLAKLTLRDLSKLTEISNPYLSQIERGIHRPSVAVITSIASALNLSAEALLAQAAGLDPDHEAEPYGDTETAIRNDPGLSTEQKDALLTVYRSYLDQ